jgi:hypothetical protein
VNAELVQQGFGTLMVEYGNNISTAKDWANGHVHDTGDFFRKASPGQAEQKGSLDAAETVKAAESERFKWELATGASASKALDCWLRNDKTTVADCASTAVAIQLDVLRERLGDTLFDKLCSEHSNGAGNYLISHSWRDTLLAYFTDEIDFYKAGTPKGSVGNRPSLQVGDMVYFQNFERYRDLSLKKLGHVGLFVGENSTYLGDDQFEGFGVKRCSEFEMYLALAEHHVLDCFEGATEENIRDYDSKISMAAKQIEKNPKLGLLTEIDSAEGTGTHGRRLSERRVLEAVQTGQLPR